MIDELNKYYGEVKEVLDVLPTNNKNNVKKKIIYIEEELKKDNDKISLVKNQIESVLHKFDVLKVDDTPEKIKLEIEKCNILNEWNIYNTSYEKMNLDYYLYQLDRYYKEDLASVNSCIKKIIESFKKVDITLTKDDFDFNTCASLYMEKVINNSGEEELEAYFEELYWKNPDIIKTIEVNFKSIYLKNEKKIDKYYENRHEQFEKMYKDYDLQGIRIKLNDQLELVNGKDPYINFQKFVNGEYLLSDYKVVDIEKKKSAYFERDSYSFNELKELYKVINEYNIIVKYKYIFDDMKTKLQSKDTFKNSKSNVLKELNKKSAELRKLNLSQDKKPLFGKKKADEKWVFKYKEALNGVIEEYEKLNTANFEDLIYSKLTQDSSILDVLKLVVSNYIYFVNKTIEVDESLSISSITDKYNELKDYVNNNSFILLENIALLDEKQMKELISNKYNLQNITISVDSLMNDNIDKTIEDLKTLINYENIVLSGLSIDDITLYLDYKKLNSQ